MTKKTKNTHFHLKEPKAASDILAYLLKSRHLEQKISEYEAFPRWDEIVGEKFAKVCKPEKIIRGKILVAKTIDAVWAQELSMQKNTFIDKVYELGIGAYIEDIRFEVSNPKDFGK